MFTPDTILPILFRLIHLVAGVIWLGLLYYLNLIQIPFMKEIDTPIRKEVVLKLLPRVLFWSRWSAVVTLLAGMGLMVGGHFRNPAIMIGATLGLIMFLNVWVIIFPNQKAIILMTADTLSAGTPVPPDIEPYVRRVFWASRFNFWLSFPMLLFMGASSHFPQ
ncbi:MAG: urate hydroxylase PuuD [Nitrospira sp.]|nr:hypothetical protein [Candidatus Manganitrophaceae bacterium]HIL35219.1 hypothetical protein [Candidatus Manganitrophaceae bacterium]